MHSLLNLIYNLAHNLSGLKPFNIIKYDFDIKRYNLNG